MSTEGSITGNSAGNNPTLPAPENLTSTELSRYTTITWSEVPGADHYVVRLTHWDGTGEDATGYSDPIGSPKEAHFRFVNLYAGIYLYYYAGNGATYLPEIPQDYRTYNIQVAAVNALGVGFWSAPYTLPDYTPDTPTNVVVHGEAGENSPNGYRAHPRISWDDKMASRYAVYKYVERTGPYPQQDRLLVGITQDLGYTDTSEPWVDIYPAFQYYHDFSTGVNDGFIPYPRCLYTVTAINDVGGSSYESPQSSYPTIIVGDPADVPTSQMPAPANVSVSQAPGEHTLITWAGVPGAFAYRIYRSGDLIADNVHIIPYVYTGGKYSATRGFQVAAITAEGLEGVKSPLTYGTQAYNPDNGKYHVHVEYSGSAGGAAPWRLYVPTESPRFSARLPLNGLMTTLGSTAAQVRSIYNQHFYDAKRTKYHLLSVTGSLQGDGLDIVFEQTLSLKGIDELFRVESESLGSALTVSWYLEKRDGTNTPAQTSVGTSWG